LRARHGAEIAAALRAAIDLLDERQRALLRYSMVSGWSIDRIGELYGVHRATASRWVAAARDALGEHLRREVSQRLAIPLEDVDSIVRAVHSQIDVSLARIL
jgi:RNA polymerase sigma-70 factor (ECF subfamily)